MTSSFLSMWLSNTATTAMMLPIANAILESLFGNLETLKEKCKSPSDPELDLINGTEPNHLLKCVFIHVYLKTKLTSISVLTLVQFLFALYPKCERIPQTAQVYFNLVLVSK